MGGGTQRFDPQMTGDSETIPQVIPEILNIPDKDKLNYWLSKFVVEVSSCFEEEFYVVRNSKVELQLITTRTFMRINFHYFFRFWVCLSKIPQSRDLYR